MSMWGAAGGSLLPRRNMEGFYAKLLNGLRGRRGQSLSDGEIGRCRALNDFRGGAACGPAMPVLFTMRADATWLVLLPLKEIAGHRTPFRRNVLLVSRWPLAQMG